MKAQNALTLQLEVFNADQLQMLFLSDLDLAQAGSAADLFKLTIIKNTPEEYPAAQMNIRVTKDNTLLLEAQSESFRIPADPPGTTYETDNRELINNNFFLHPGDPTTNIRIKESRLSDDVEEIQKEVLSSGKVPIGVYRLIVDIVNLQTSSPIVHEEIPFLQATNPSFVRLISPGVPFGSPAPSSVYTEYPVFQWNGNGDEYKVFVFEKKSMIQSMDDILNQLPNWESEPISEQSVIYPQSGDVIPLEYGKTYYWMVQMQVHTSAGILKVNSEIWEFKLKNPAESGVAHQEISKMEVIKFLKDVLGSQVDGLEKSLEGYRTAVIRYNGREIEIQDLYRLLQEYQNRKVEVFDLILPSASE
ncbi:MAG TPA: hypothetical protein ENJ89_08440 [Caldithrix abyssi]|uniref:Uncharacterized protein n=1 Tax=Caldithrix abyssi TaxID=187145 RepID=A0A7V5UFC5_CALAY|nr:hypothetical protein [Caldithrix abyssi]